MKNQKEMPGWYQDSTSIIDKDEVWELNSPVHGVPDIKDSLMKPQSIMDKDRPPKYPDKMHAWNTKEELVQVYLLEEKQKS